MTGAISQAAFARVVGVSKVAVFKAIQTGRLSGEAVTADRKIMTDAALAQWKAKQDPRADLTQTADGADGDDAYRVARTRAAELDVERKELELAERRGLHLPKAEVEREMVTAGRTIRMSIDQLPAMAEEIAALGGDVAAVRALLRKRSREIETVIAEVLAPDARG